MSFDSFTREVPIKKIVIGHEPKDNEDPDEDKDIIPVNRMQVTSSFDVLKGLNVGSFNSMATLDVKDMYVTSL